MHPILQSRLRLALYFIAWAGIGLLLAGVIALASGRPMREALALVGPLVLVYTSVCLSAWWVCRSHPLGRDPLRTLATLAGSALLTSALWVALARLWSVLLGRLFHVPIDQAVRARELAILFVGGVLLYLLSAVVHYLVIAFENTRAAERRALEAQVAGREAELRALRAQLHPHFLFNSLNSISALAGADPEGARRMCEGLGDFFRRTLSLANREAVPLADELALVERYLAIERVRFGARLVVVRDVTAAAERCLIPPLLLQPLVENAVKHGVSERLEGGTVRLGAERADGLLLVTVENEYDADGTQRPGEGRGLEIVRQRLTAIAPRAASLSTLGEGGRYRVTLTLPAIEQEVAP